MVINLSPGGRQRFRHVGRGRPAAGWRRLVALGLLALVGSGALAGCRRQPPNLDSPGTTIVCLGDSITAGVGTTAGHAYPALLAARLGREVLDAGVPGDTAGTGLARLPQVLAQDPWLVIVELGGNDILQQVPIADTEAALDQILQRLLAARVVPVLVAVSGPFGGAHAEIYDRLASRYHVPVVDRVLRDILLDPTLKSDEVHPNDAGHARLADAIAGVVEPLVAARHRRFGR
jgi:acyl-CoA thioesterase I